MLDAHSARVRGASALLMILSLLASLLVAMPAAAVAGPAGDDFPAGGEEPSTGRFIVLLDEPPLARYGGGIAGLAATAPEATGADRLDVGTPASRAYLAHLDARQAAVIGLAGATLGRSLDVFGQYRVTLNAFAAEMSAAEASALAGLAGVSRVAADTNRYLMTDNGPEWIGAPGIWDGSESGGTATRGEGMVIGVIDTGVNPDHPSFADIGGDGYNHTNPRHTFFGLCNPGNGAPFCNDKLIGVYDFTGTGPEDDNGHGSHTASTSGGNVLTAELIAPTITVARPISGVAPHANLITYKACVTTPAIGTCPISALLLAIDQATADAVDVVNFSIGGGSSDPWGDLDAQAMLNGRAAGVFFSVSAGNEGPGAATVGSPADAPWVLSVGASTHDRQFNNRLTNLASDSTPLADIAGRSLTAGHPSAPIVYAGDYGFPLCGDGPANEATGEAAINPFTPGTFDGETVVCDRGTYGRVEKAQNVMEGGAGGYVLANDEASGNSLVGDPYPIPGVHITYADGLVLKAWLASGSGESAAISGTLADENPASADIMASFSSRGPNPATGDLLKPDVTAPGVDILAAFNTPLGESGPPEYGVISGTSMSSPHAAGSATLLRALHPDWSPAEVQSAMVSSAFANPPGDGTETHPMLKEDGASPADPFDMGGGRVNLHAAGRAGLVLDETADDYTAADPALGGDPSAINQASLAQDGCSGSCTWTRTLTSTASTSVTWTASVAAPSGMALSVSPASFTVAPGAAQAIEVTADVSGLAAEAWHFAHISLVPDQPTIPEVSLPVATFVTPGGGASERTVLHFHGNPGEHGSGEPAEADCTGVGAADLDGCGGPFLLPSDQLSPAPAAAFGPIPVVLDCATDRCVSDPNWIWNLAEPTTLAGPMTVEWWYGCPGCSLAFFEDFFIRLWADGELVHEERVRHTQIAPGVPVRLASTLTVPEVTAGESFVLVVDPIFINQDQSFVYYDSTQACPGGTVAPCDSLVRMPVVSEEPAPADLVVSDITTQTGTGGGTPNGKPRQGDKVTIVATVMNQGDTEAGPTVTAFELDGSPMAGSAVPTGPIAAGGTAEVRLNWDTRGVSGEHDITVTADSGEAVAESVEGNNSSTRHVTVRGNKVQNGSFEGPSADGSGPEAWSGHDTEAGTTSWSEGGSEGEHSATITGTGGNAALAGVPTWTSAPIGVTAGEVLTLTAQVSTGGVSSAPSIGLAHLGPAGELLQTVTLLTAPLRTAGFVALEQTLTIPAGVAEVRVVLAGFAPTDLATSGTVTFDEIGLYAE